MMGTCKIFLIANIVDGKDDNKPYSEMLMVRALWHISHLDLTHTFFCCNTLFHMQEILTLVFQSYKKVLLPGLEPQTLD